MDEERLIFIISQPRAGSTLLQRILANHSDIYSRGESWFLLPLVHAYYKDVSASYDSGLARRAINEQIRLGNLPSAVIGDKLAGLTLSLYGSILDQRSERHFLDKTPRYYYIIAELKQLFPKAKIILLLRNPVAVLSSIIKTWYTNLQSHYDDVCLAPVLLSNHLSDAFVVRYESLLSNSEMELKSLCGYLNLRYDPQLLNVNKSNHRVEFGDPTGQYSYENINTLHHKSYLNLASQSYQHWSLLYSYTQAMSRTTFDKLGYNKGQIVSDLTNIKPKTARHISFNNLFGLDTTFQLGFYFEEYIEKFNLYKGSYLAVKNLLTGKSKIPNYNYLYKSKYFNR
ncbi:MAG: sulfotransferase [Bacteroidota bacterium]